MRVRITGSYTDSILGRVVHKDEEFSVSEARAKRLIESGVAQAVSEDIADYTAKIAELEKALNEKDARAAELEKALNKLTAEVKGASK